MRSKRAWWARSVALALLVGFALSQALALSLERRFEYGLDYVLYMERAQSWLSGGGFYLPMQLAGPYQVVGGVATYPPVALLLFVPLSFIPWPVWWIVPLAVIGLAIRAMRPTTEAWWVLALVAVWPRTWTAILLGNPSMWAFAALAAGLVWGWPAVLVPLKATLGPFALVGANRRSWWLGAGLFILLAVPFGSMWFDYVAALRNAQPTEQFGFGYVMGEWPIALGLVIAAFLSGRFDRLHAVVYSSGVGSDGRSLSEVH